MRRLAQVEDELREAKLSGSEGEIADLRTIRSKLIHGHGCTVTPEESAARRRQTVRRYRRSKRSKIIMALMHPAQESCQLPPKSAEMGAATPEIGPPSAETVPVGVADRLYEAFRAYVDGLSDTEAAQAALNAYVLAAPE